MNCPFNIFGSYMTKCRGCQCALSECPNVACRALNITTFKSFMRNAGMPIKVKNASPARIQDKSFPSDGRAFFYTTDISDIQTILLMALLSKPAEHRGIKALSIADLGRLQLDNCFEDADVLGYGVYFVDFSPSFAKQIAKDFDTTQGIYFNALTRLSNCGRSTIVCLMPDTLSSSYKPLREALDMLNITNFYAND